MARMAVLPLDEVEIEIRPGDRRSEALDTVWCRLMETWADILYLAGAAASTIISVAAAIYAGMIWRRDQQASRDRETFARRLKQ